MKQLFLSLMLALLPLAAQADAVETGFNQPNDLYTTIDLGSIYMNYGDCAKVTWLQMQSQVLANIGNYGITKSQFENSYYLDVVGGYSNLPYVQSTNVGPSGALYDNAAANSWWAVRYAIDANGNYVLAQNSPNDDNLSRLNTYTADNNWFGRVWYNPIGNTDDSTNALLWQFDNTDANASNMTRSAYERLMVLLGASYSSKGLSTKAFSTVVRFISRNDGTSIWVKLVLPVGNINFACGDIKGRDLSKWYDYKQGYRDNTADTIEVYANVPTPAEVNRQALTFSNFQKDLKDYWLSSNVGITFNDASHFSNFTANGALGTMFQFRLPRSGVNTVDLNANIRGEWQVDGFSGNTYTLYLKNNRSEIWAKQNTAAGMTADELICTLTTDGIITYKGGSSYGAAADILNLIGMYDATGKNQKSTYLTGHNKRTFAAYVEINVNTAYYTPLVGKNYFNVRFLRPVNVWPAEHQVISSVNKTDFINLSEMLYIRDWRTYAVVLDGKTQKFGNKAVSGTGLDGRSYTGQFGEGQAPYSFYGISNLYVAHDQIRTDFNLTKAQRSTVLTSPTDIEALSSIESVSELSQYIKIIPNTAVSSYNVNSTTGLSASTSPDDVIAFTNASATGRDFHIYVPVSVVYPWGTQNGKTQVVWAVITIDAQGTENIVFADANVKNICVQKWDANGDGELSEAEAAAVTDLGSVFTGNQDITSFTELQYFTGLTSIPESAFFGCDDLTSVSIPCSVTSIAKRAFGSCPNLNSVTIPSSVTFIDNWAFLNSSGLTSMSVESGNTVYDSRNSCNAIIETATNTLIAGCKNTVIPNSVTSIGEEAFSHCSLTSITIPNSVTSIGEAAFYYCSSLTSITIPNSVTSIGEEAFHSCRSLTSITIPNSVTSIGDGAFYLCTSLTSITIPNSVTSIADVAFSGCRGLTSITIPNSVTSIGEQAFFYCSSLASITIPNSVTSIGEQAFRNCSSLTSITIPNSVTSIGSYAFSGCTGLISVTVENPEPIAIDASAFDNCANATLYVPAGAKAAYAAAGWSGFKEIVEAGVTTTDISQLDNVIYIEDTEARTGSEKMLSVRMKNTVDIAGFEFVLQLPEGVTIAKDEDGLNEVALSTERTTAAKTNYFDSSLRTDGTLKVLCGTSRQNPDTQLLYTFSGTDGEVATIKLLVSEDMEEGEYPIVLKNIKVSDPNAVKYETEAVTSKLTVSTYTPGDVNGDGSIDVADFIAVANRILDRTPAAFIEKAGDINEDGTIDVADFIATANLILHSTASNSQQAPKATRRAATDIDALSDVIYVEPVTASAGTQQVLSVKMKNTAEVAGFEFCLQLPDGITIVTEDETNKVELSTERTTAAKTNYFDSSVQSDGTLKVLCGTSREDQSTHKLYTFSGNDGEVARITVNIPAGYQSGEYAVIVKNAIIADPDAQKTVLPDAETTLTVTEPQVLVLDETSTTVPEATTGPVDIKVKRTLKAGEWSTVCLPFAMTEAQVKEAFGSDVELKEFVDYEAEYDADDNVTNIKVNFEDADLSEYGFEANFPYLIKVSADISEFTVNSTVEPDENDCYIEYDNGKTGSRRKVYGTFYGTLHAQTTVPENCLFLSGNKFWYSTGQTKMKAFRGYFKFVDVLSSLDAASARINLSFNGSETTGVSEVVNRKSETENWYDLQGRRVEKPTRGLYIKGNKKVFVK